MNSLKTAALAAAALFGLAGGALAMPATPPATLALDAPAQVETVRWHCGPYGCGYHRPRFFAPRPFYGYGYGYRRFGYGGWHRHHRWARW